MSNGETRCSETLSISRYFLRCDQTLLKTLSLPEWMREDGHARPDQIAQPGERKNGFPFRHLFIETHTLGTHIRISSVMTILKSM
jgi:hypothetical protein